MNHEEKAREIGGNRLVKFFDDIQTEQRKRWAAPSWQTQPITDADLVNWADISRALIKQIVYDP